MNYKRRHLQRRSLVLFVISVLPLFADDVQQLQHEQHESTSDYDATDISSSIPQNVLNERQQQRQGTATEATVYRRTFTEGVGTNRGLWVEHVTLPMQYNSSSNTIVPFYPFQLEDIVDYDGTTSITSNTKRRSQQWNMLRTTAPMLNDSDGTNSVLKPNMNMESNRKEADDTSTSTTASTTATTTTTTTTLTGGNQSKATTTTIKHVEVDYASKSAGAVVLDSSINFQGASNLLQQDRDKYAIVPCSEESKYVVIGLSEDILVKQIAIANYERYSSHMKDIRVHGSASTSAIRQRDHWIHLGNFLATTKSGGDKNNDVQTFDLLDPTWARYIKIEFLSHYGDEYYCTVSQISVHGSTVLQGFHEQWNEENNDIDKETVQQQQQVHDDDTTSTKNNTDDATMQTSRNNVSGDTNEKIVTQLQDDTETNGATNNTNANIDTATTNTSSTSSETTTTTMEYRYNFSRLAGCRNSMSFEANLIHFTILNNNVTDDVNGIFVSDDDESSSISTVLRPRSLLNQFCKPTTTGMTKILRRPPIRKLQVRQPSKQILESTTNNILSKSNVTMTNGQSISKIVFRNYRHLAKLSSGLERVAEFLRHALVGGAINTSNDTSSTQFNATGPVDTTANDQNGDASTKMRSMHSDEKPTILSEIEEAVSTADDVSKYTVKQDINDVSAETVLEETGLMIANLLKRVPSVKCLESLNFADFKTNIKATSTKSRTGSSSGANSGSGASGNAAVNMEPIFKKLTDEIKSLQSNVAIHDQFAKESVSCYQRVIFELLLEMEMDRRSFDRRISKLEDEIHFTTFVVALRRLILQMLTSALHYLTNSIQELLSQDQSIRKEGVLGDSSIRLVLIISATFMLIVVMKIGRRRRKVIGTTITTLNSNEPKEINIVESNGTISFQQYANHNEHDDDDDSSADIIPGSPHLQSVFGKETVNA